MQKQIITDIKEKLMKYNTIILTSHINPDGDAISSSYGLALALKQAFPQKKILVIGDPDDIENRFKFLKLKRDMFISPTQKIRGHFVAIIGDTSVSTRINGYDIVKHANTKICFDHHDTPADITYDIFWSEPKYYASSLQAIEIANILLEKLTQEIAFCLIIGVYTDTNNFRYSLADPQPLKQVAKCLKYIEDRTMDIFFNKLFIRTKNHIKITKYATKKIKFKNSFAYVIFTIRELKKYPSYLNIGKMVNIISNIEGMTKWCFFTENKNDENKKEYQAHLRSNGPSLISIAKKYNGGGHHRAAGCTIKKTKIRNFIKEMSNY